MHKFEKGFSLLEILIVLAIVGILATAGSGFYANYGKNIEINSVAGTITSDLKLAQAKSMIGESNYIWGLHFVNAATDYYEIFHTPTDYSVGIVTSTNYLFSGVVFSDPSEGSSKNIIFNKISGGTSISSIAITSFGITKTISVSSIGTISVQ